jgi:hypothetical protein
MKIFKPKITITRDLFDSIPPSTSSNINTATSDITNDDKNGITPQASAEAKVTSEDKYNGTLKELIEELQDDIETDKLKLKRKEEKLKLLQAAYDFK